MTNEEKNFPDKPDWEKVNKFTDIILNILNNNKLTFTERYNIIALVESAINRDFNMIGVLSFLDDIYKKEEALDLQRTQHVYR